ncbi:MAG: hypothetical protein WKI04_17865 [Ferruginibacter sp.]
MTTEASSSAYSFWRMLSRVNTKQVGYTTLTYDSTNALTLDFYPAMAAGKNPALS